MHCKGVNHEVMRALMNRQHIFISDDWPEPSPNSRKWRYDQRRRKGSVNLGQSLMNFVADLFMQKGLGCTAAVPGQGGPVCQKRWRQHGAENGGADMGMQAFVHMVYPPQCICCDALVTTDFGLCGTCWRDTPFITGLTCDLCGTPMPGSEGGVVAHCDDCLRVARPWSKGGAVFLYRDRGRDIVLQLKHSDRVELARATGPWLLRSAAPLLEEDSVIAPIPLHWTRLLRRKYNQSALLAGELARLSGHRTIPDLLYRVRRTASQEGRDRDARFKNLQDSISVTGRNTMSLRGRSVLLVDDVMTSGATFAAATEACHAAGARRVSVLALARVAKDA